MRGAALVLLTFSLGCSAVVDPDESLLGGEDPVACPGGCDDGVPCTEDSCVDGVCRNAPDDMRCAPDLACHVTMGCVGGSCTSDADCSDGNPCNGQERCDGDTCVGGEAMVCDDGVSCTEDRCDPATGECVSTPNDALCSDGFCFSGGRCNPMMGCVGGADMRDCDDGDACTEDSCDASAMMCVNRIIDGDGDGFGPIDLCGGGQDCDDDDGSVFPDAVEMCNGVDDDCDDNIDEGACMMMLPDTCATVQTIEVVGSEVMFAGSFTDYESDYASACAGPDQSAEDLVFRLVLEPNTDYLIDTVGSTADTVLAVSDRCGEWNYLDYSCHDDIVRAANRASRIYPRSLSRTGGMSEIFILLDRYNSTVATDTDFVLKVRKLPAPGDDCEGAPVVTMGTTVVGHIPEGGFGGLRPSCNLASNRSEHIFRVVRQGDGESSLYSPQEGSALFSQTGCSVTASQPECDDRGSPPLTVDNPRRESFLVVADAGPGFYSLELEP